MLFLPIQYSCGEAKVMYFRQTNPIFEKKNRNLDKQTAPSSTIKHQRDKQIIFVYRVGIHSFNLSEGY